MEWVDEHAEETQAEVGDRQIDQVRVVDAPQALVPGEGDDGQGVTGHGQNHQDCQQQAQGNGHIQGEQLRSITASLVRGYSRIHLVPLKKGILWKCFDCLLINDACFYHF